MFFACECRGRIFDARIDDERTTLRRRCRTAILEIDPAGPIESRTELCERLATVIRAEGLTGRNRDNDFSNRIGRAEPRARVQMDCRCLAVAMPLDLNDVLRRVR